MFGRFSKTSLPVICSGDTSARTIVPLDENWDLPNLRVSKSTDEKLAIFVLVSDLLRISVVVAPRSSSNETPAGLVLRGAGL